MRTYISPIGFNSTSVTRPLLNHGVDTGDTVVLIRPDVEDDSRAREAISDVEQLLQEIEPDVSVTTERITYSEFSTAVLECSDLIRAAGGERIVTLGGGARDVLVPFALAATTHVRLLDAVLFFSDIDGAVREWKLPVLTATLGDASRPTLEALQEADGEASIPTLTEKTGRSKSTVTRHVNHLTDEGIVETWTEGKTKYVRITLTGRLLLRGDS
jgi:CRISPR-associated protein Csa3